MLAGDGGLKPGIQIRGTNKFRVRNDICKPKIFGSIRAAGEARRRRQGDGRGVHRPEDRAANDLVSGFVGGAQSAPIRRKTSIILPLDLRSRLIISNDRTYLYLEWLSCG
jgi:hypothetical protein